MKCDKPILIRFLFAALLTSVAVNGTAAESQLRTWAILGSPEITRLGVTELLAVKLSTHPDIELVERENVDAAVKELTLAAILASENVNSRLRLGAVTGADGILLLTLGDHPTQKVISATLVDTRFGARIGLHRIGFDKTNPEQTVNQCVSFVEATQKRLVRGVEVVIGISDFLSTDVAHRYDYLQVSFAALIESALIQQPGIAVLESREAELILQEFATANSSLKGNRMPLFVEGEYSVAANGGNPVVNVEIHIRGQKKTIKTIRIDQEPLESVGDTVRTMVPPLVLEIYQLQANEIGSGEQHYEYLIKRANAFASLGAWESAIGLREAALLLRPRAEIERAMLMREYREWINRHVKRNSYLGKWNGRTGLSWERLQELSELELRQFTAARDLRHRRWLSLCRHTRHAVRVPGANLNRREIHWLAYSALHLAKTLKSTELETNRKLRQQVDDFAWEMYTAAAKRDDGTLEIIRKVRPHVDESDLDMYVDAFLSKRGAYRIRQAVFPHPPLGKPAWAMAPFEVPHSGGLARFESRRAAFMMGVVNHWWIPDNGFRDVSADVIPETGAKQLIDRYQRIIDESASTCTSPVLGFFSVLDATEAPPGHLPRTPGVLIRWLEEGKLPRAQLQAFCDGMSASRHSLTQLYGRHGRIMLDYYDQKKRGGPLSDVLIKEAAGLESEVSRRHLSTLAGLHRIRGIGNTQKLYPTEPQEIHGLGDRKPPNLEAILSPVRRKRQDRSAQALTFLHQSVIDGYREDRTRDLDRLVYGSRIKVGSYKGFEPCGAEADCIWSTSRIRVAHREGAFTIVYNARAAERSILDVKYDGKHLWILNTSPSKDRFQQDAEIRVIGLGGKTVATIGADDGLPPMYGSAGDRPYLFPVEPGRCAVIGITGEFRRVWIAMVSTHGDKESPAKIIYQARKIPPADRTENTPQDAPIAWPLDRIFSVGGVVRYRPRELPKKDLLLISRNYRGAKLTPLAIDLNNSTAAEYVADPRWLPRYPYNRSAPRPYVLDDGRVLTTSSEGVIVHTLPTPANPKWTHQTLIPLDDADRSLPSGRYASDSHLHEGHIYFTSVGPYTIVLDATTLQVRRKLAAMGSGTRLVTTVHHGLIHCSHRGGGDIRPVSVFVAKPIEQLIEEASIRGTAHRAGLAIRRLGGLYGKPRIDDRSDHIPPLCVVLTKDWQGGDKGLAYLLDFGKVQRVYIYQAPISNAGMQYLSQLTGLRVLHLVETNVTDEGLKAFATRKWIFDELRLEPTVDGREFTDSALDSVQQFRVVRRLEIVGPGFTDACLDKCPKLMTSLVARGTNLTREGILRHCEKHMFPWFD